MEGESARSPQAGSAKLMSSEFSEEFNHYGCVVEGISHTFFEVTLPAMLFGMEDITRWLDERDCTYDLRLDLSADSAILVVKLPSQIHDSSSSLPSPIEILKPTTSWPSLFLAVGLGVFVTLGTSLVI